MGLMDDTVIARGGYGGGWGGDSSWLGMLLVIALLGGRGFGFGGHDGGYGHGKGGCGCEGFGRTNEKQLDFINTEMNSRFNNLQNQMDFNNSAMFQKNILDNICQTNRNMDQNTYALSREVGAIGAALQNCCCETQKGLLENRYIGAKETSELRHAIDMCCCHTNSHIDKVMHQNERDTCRIIENASHNTQRILDRMAYDELREANMRINELERLNSESRIVAAMKPVAPVPAYIQPSPYEAYYPQGRFNNFGDCRPC